MDISDYENKLYKIARAIPEMGEIEIPFICVNETPQGKMRVRADLTYKKIKLTNNPVMLDFTFDKDDSDREISNTFTYNLIKFLQKAIGCLEPLDKEINALVKQPDNTDTDFINWYPNLNHDRLAWAYMSKICEVQKELWSIDYELAHAYALNTMPYSSDLITTKSDKIYDRVISNMFTDYCRQEWIRTGKLIWAYTEKRCYDMNVIRGFSDYLHIDINNSPTEYKGALKEIQEHVMAGLGMKNLLNDVLDYLN